MKSRARGVIPHGSCLSHFSVLTSSQVTPFQSSDVSFCRDKNCFLNLRFCLFVAEAEFFLKPWTIPNQVCHSLSSFLLCQSLFELLHGLSDA